MKGGLNARFVRILLIVVMLLVVAGATGGFLYVLKDISNYATAISSLNADAESGDMNLVTLKKLEDRLKNENEQVSDARAVLEDEATYGDKVISDISKIAKDSGVTITGFEFVDIAAATGSAAVPNVAVAPGTVAPTVVPLPAGIVKKAVSVNVRSPLSYSSLMNFLSKLETNELQLQVSSVSITKDKDAMVATQPFIVELYVRKAKT